MPTEQLRCSNCGSEDLTLEEGRPMLGGALAVLSCAMGCPPEKHKLTPDQARSFGIDMTARMKRRETL